MPDDFEPEGMQPSEVWVKIGDGPWQQVDYVEWDAEDPRPDLVVEGDLTPRFKRTREPVMEEGDGEG